MSLRCAQNKFLKSKQIRAYKVIGRSLLPEHTLNRTHLHRDRTWRVLVFGHRFRGRPTYTGLSGSQTRTEFKIPIYITSKTTKNAVLRFSPLHTYVYTL